MILGDGREVAIKWIDVARKDSPFITESKTHAFITEIKTLPHVKHKNLMRLLGFHARHSECALVYEYMKNCSLYYHLHTIGSSTLMSWNARLKVAPDVARGIDYLHEFADDIEDSVVSTWAYVDLECFLPGRLTTKSDVYGYGVVLPELLSGRKAVDRDGDGLVCLITDAVVPRILRGEIGKALDPNMPIPATFEMTAVAHIAYLAGDCVRRFSRDHPSIICVVDRLRSTLAQFSSEFCDDMGISGCYKSRLYLSQWSDDAEMANLAL
ncbi:hypothetical protein NL676_023653 [Syzygium grande]|nr:hypothetical protein NL676_023653 [Syzygium grande]